MKIIFTPRYLSFILSLIDHSNAKRMIVDVECDAVNVTIWVRDDGVGIFENDWLLEQNSTVSGTAVMMKMARNSGVCTADVFEEYSDPDRQPSFHKTRIPVKLMEYEGEALLSRSQAKRLIMRFDRFVEVILDFQGVSEIGQAFADEIFRVFRNAHPAVNIVPINCAPSVRRMIAHVSPDSA